MKTLRYIAASLALIVALLGCVTLASCSDDPVADNTEGYGYVQFKLYKNSSRAATQLDSLRQAHKVRVLLQHEGKSIEQTLLLNATNDASAAYGLRSDKLPLLAGEYDVIGFYLYDIMDKEIDQYSVPQAERHIVVESGGLTMHSL